MAIERFEQSINIEYLDRCMVLYGLGTIDSFVSTDYVEQTFKQAFYDFLFEHGFERIVFYEPHKGLFFFDTTSLERCRLGSVSSTTVNHIKPSKGPLKRRLLIKEDQAQFTADKVSQQSKVAGLSIMSDERAISLLNAFMKNEDWKTAVVILQADEVIDLFESIRELRTYVTSWIADLPPRNQNTSFWVFHRSNVEDIEFKLRERMPSMQHIVMHKGNSTNKLICLQSPDYNELHRLLTIKRLKGEIQYSFNDLKKLLHWFEAENKPLKDWSTQLHGQIDRKRVTEKRWISSIFDERSAIERLDALTGLYNAKKQIQMLRSYAEANKLKKAEGKETAPVTLHLAFIGNPGTGKTTVARLVGEIYRDLGLLKRGHIKEVECAAQMIAEHIGGTSVLVNGLVNEALDGVLFIDEAYYLGNKENPFARDAMTTLLARMENERERIAVIVAGYPKEMEHFFKANTGFASRFPMHIIFDDYNPDELKEILMNMLESNYLSVDSETDELLTYAIKGMYAERTQNFGNAREMRNLMDCMHLLWSDRRLLQNLPTDTPLISIDLPEEYNRYVKSGKQSLTTAESTQQILDEINNMVGLRPVKEQLEKIVARVVLEKHQKRSGTISVNLHMAFSGEPGTGKTTVARMISRIYHTLGLLPKSSYVELQPEQVIGEYIGSTEAKAAEIFERAKGGVLFIDEAYRYTNHVYGKNFIDSLITFMENNLNKVAVIVAAYPNQMNIFLDSNEGLRSRFGNIITFPNYTPSEVAEIVVKMAEEESYIINADVRTVIETYLNALCKLDGFSNGRTGRNLFDEMKNNLALRLYKTTEKRTPESNYVFKVEDVPYL